MSAELLSFLTTTDNADWGALLLRLAIGLSWLPWGVAKLKDTSKAAGFPRVFGMSPKLSYMTAAAIETAVPLMIILGFLTRLAVIPGIVCMAVAYKVSVNNHYCSPAAPYLLGQIAIFLMGPGAYSLDYLCWPALF